MQPNDIVFIAEQPITRWNRALNQIFPSIISTANAATN
jgi:polysaccharide export outer membrane protein